MFPSRTFLLDREATAVRMRAAAAHAGVLVAVGAVLLSAPAPAHAGGVSFTWLGVTHWIMETPEGAALLDAYVSRPPFSATGPTTEGLDLFRRIIAVVNRGDRSAGSLLDTATSIMPWT